MNTKWQLLNQMTQYAKGHFKNIDVKNFEDKKTRWVDISKKDIWAVDFNSDCIVLAEITKIGSIYGDVVDCMFGKVIITMDDDKIYRQNSFTHSFTDWSVSRDAFYEINDITVFEAFYKDILWLVFSR